MVLDKLITYWQKSFPDWRGLQTFNKTSRRSRSVVFYAETSADWAWLGPVADYLEKSGQEVARVTSDRKDPVLSKENSFYIGSMSARTIFFRTVDVDVFVMTLTDLDRFYLKRSKYPVQYVYIFHSIQSMHRVYRKHALDSYDVIFCVGPHHLNEIRKTEELYGLKKKELIKHGYGRLDTLIKDIHSRVVAKNADESIYRVLVAPTWGDSSLISHNLLEPIISKLINANFQVVLRLHPMVKRDNPDIVEAFVKKFSAFKNFQLDPYTNATDSLIASDIMISEWSGSALEYAFALERPVIFIDTPPKTFNSEYDRIGLPCLEEEIRSKVGIVVAPDSIDQLPEFIIDLKNNQSSFSENIKKFKNDTVYNIGTSAQIGAEYIAELLRKSQTRRNEL
jgi:YidC/Oxa1 family membrane protein insertase